MSAAVPITLEKVCKDMLDDFISAKTFKVMLCTGQVLSAHDNISDLTEITPGHGYSAGGPTLTVTSNQDGTNAYLKANQPMISASGGTIGPYQGIAIYEVATGKLRGAANEVFPTIIPNLTSKTLEFNQDLGFFHVGRVEIG